MAEKVAEAKRVRRNHKAQLTRTLTALKSICGKEEVIPETLKELLQKAERQFEAIEEVHHALLESLADDEFEKEERWMTECQQQYFEEKQKMLKLLKKIEKEQSSLTPTRPPGEILTASMDKFKLALELPKAEIPQFNGDPTKFWSFIKNFEMNVAGKLSSDEARLSYLIQLTGGKARSSIECCILLGEEGYAKAKEILKTQFGQPHIILHALMDEMLNCRVTNNNSEALWKLISMMKKCQITLQQMGYESNLNNPENLLKIQKLLPYNIQRKWATKAQEVMNKHAEPKFQNMVEFLEHEAAALNNVFGRSLREQTSRPKTFATDIHVNEDTCPNCEGFHKLWNCEEFRKMNVDERWATATEKKLCFKCFGKHQARNCRRKMHCGIDGCSSDHNRLLHKTKFKERRQDNKREVVTKSKSEKNSDETESAPTTTTMMARSKEVALRTVPVTVKYGDNVRKVNALLDDGSTQTYINADLATDLGIMGAKETITVEVINGKTEQFETMPVQISLRSVDGKTTMKVNALTTNNVTGLMYATEWCKLKSKWHHLSDIPFQPVSERGKIDILIGSDYPELHMCLDERQGKRNEPIACLTPLGWTCIGKINQSDGNSYFARTYKCDVNKSDQIIKKFWEIDNTGIQRRALDYSLEEQRVVDKVGESLYRTNEGRYGVKVPWRDGIGKSHKYDNYDMALKRLQGLEKRLQRDPGLKAEYKNVIGKYVEKEYISKVNEVDKNDVNARKNYLPHFPVVRAEKETTKVRIVFDASAQNNDQPSLNEMIDAGPKLHRDLFDVLLRFRHHKVALICDISEMYMQFEIAKEDRSMLRFLWRDESQTGDPDIYEFQRLPFGVNVAPFVAQYVAQHNAKLHEQKYPRAAETVLKSTYMDDSMDSVPSVEAGVELYEELVKLWEKAGMKAHKWITNNHEVMAKIPIESRAREIKLNEEDLPSVKALGLCWKAQEDMFTFTEPEVTNQDKKLTKRKVLSKIASVFDPLGFLSPVVTAGKMLMQQMWVDGLQWDETMEGELADAAQKWLGDLKNLGEIKIQRCLNPNEGAVELHTFVDASEDAYASVVYLCSTYDKEKISRFVASKTKVAPVKSMSIPRLELMAAVLGVRLTIAVTQALEVNIEDVNFWSDSMNVLYWLRNRSRQFKTFVANRVGEIQDSTNPNQWRYVPSKINPADVASRGAPIKDLKSNQMWWEGPPFITQSEENWPQTKLQEPKEKEEKRKPKIVEICNVNIESSDEWRLDPRRYSNWIKLVRVQAYVQRFINNCPVPKGERQIGELEINELREAEIKVIKVAQRDVFRQEIQMLHRRNNLPPNNSLNNLNPMVDDDGLLRSSGRLSLNEAIPYDTRCPIILPRKHPVTRLIVKEHHEEGNHKAGTNHTLALLSSKYWLIGGREEIREWENACNECKRHKSRGENQIMAPLPTSRTSVDTLRAFDKVSVDFAGPFLTKQGRGKVRAKRYLCLFTCMKTRAVHLEMAFGLDTDSFLNSLYRFTSRRGNPSEIRSDNGTNFVGAQNELSKLFKSIDKAKVERETAKHGLMWKWVLNPPMAPHFGGIHESMIKSAKRAIYAILKNADINDEELLSAIVGAEGLINSRPITYQSANSKDDIPLTPNHFLHGQSGGRFAAEMVTDNTDFNPRRRWRRVQELVKHFWQRWLREYLPTLGQRKKWKIPRRDLQINDVVMILEKSNQRGHWPLGRVVEAFKGVDGHVRVVRVKTSKGEITRPITRLSRLEFND